MVKVEKDLSGMKFGRLTVIFQTEDYIIPSSKKHYARWHCVCDCGNECDVTGTHLKSGHSTSCGCVQHEFCGSINRTHGGSRDRLYGVWSSIKGRCYNINDNFYYEYGGRGIKVCDEWCDNYSEFKKWAYANGYDDKAEYMQCTIDRIDVDGDYCPENCRWVSALIQSNNRRNVHKIEYNGEIHTITEWSNIIGIKRDILYRRLIVKNIGVEQAFTM